MSGPARNARNNNARPSARPTKTVLVCLKRDPKPAAECTGVHLDLGIIVGWGDELVAALAGGLAGTGMDSVVASVWLREDDGDPLVRLDKDKWSAEKRWKKLMDMDDDAVLLLGVDASSPSVAYLRGLDDGEVEYSPEDQQNYERLTRLFLKDPRSIVCALQDVSTLVRASILAFNGGRVQWGWVGGFNVAVCRANPRRSPTPPTAVPAHLESGVHRFSME